MPEWPEPPAFYTRHGALCTADVMQSKVAWIHLCVNGTWNVSTAWGTANVALYMPVLLASPMLVTRMGVQNGTVVNGNFQLGIYDERGAQKCVSASTAQAGTSVLQSVDVTDTWLWPGTYYLALASNSTTATFICMASVATRQEISGLQEQTTAFTLPSPITLGTKSARLFVPIVSAFSNTVP